MGGEQTDCHAATVAECRPCCLCAVRSMLQEAQASLRTDGIEPGF